MDLSALDGEGINRSLDAVNQDVRPLIDELLGSTFDGQATPGPGVAACLARLAAGLARAQSAGVTASRGSDFTLDLLADPFREAGSAAKALFVPEPGQVDGGVEVETQVAAWGRQMGRAFLNPIEALMAAEFNTLAVGVNQTVKLFWNEPSAGQETGTFTRIGQQVNLLLKDLLFDPEKRAINTSGLILYGLGETIPALQAELGYLRRLKLSTAALVEQASALPPSLIPSLPNAAVTDLLCQAEGHLRRVAGDLASAHTFSRAEFSQATTKVCQAKETMFTGKLGTDTLAHLKNLYGLSDLQFNVLKTFQFMPDPRYRLETVKLIRLNTMVQTADVPVVTFARNLGDFFTSLDTFTGLHIADVLGVVITILRRQIAVVRAQLEGDAVGLKFETEMAKVEGLTATADVLRRPTAASGNSDPTVPGARTAVAGGSDIASYAGTQASCYATLSGLCFAMGQAQRLYTGIKLILEGNDVLIQRLREFTQHITTTCGYVSSAGQVNDAVQALLKASEARLAGISRDNTEITARSRDLTGAVAVQEKWLLCLDGQLNALLRYISGGLLGTKIAAAAANIVSIARRLPAFGDAVSALDIRKMQVTAGGTNAYDEVLAALQCLLLQCEGNPFLAAAARAAAIRFHAERDLESARAITMGTLDDLPRAANKVSNNRRLQSFLDLIQSLQKLTSVDLSELCNLETQNRANQRRMTEDQASATQTRADNERIAKADQTTKKALIRTRDDRLTAESVRRKAEAAKIAPYTRVGL